MKGEKAYDAGSIVPALAQNVRAGHPLFVLCPRFQRLGHPSNPNRQDASVTVETSYFTQITITFKSPGCRLNRKSSKFECYRLVTPVDYCSFAYSTLACFRTGMSEAASFPRVRKSIYAASALTRAASASAPVEFFASSAFARAFPRCASAPVQQFQTMPLRSRIFWNSTAASLP